SPLGRERAGCEDAAGRRAATARWGRRTSQPARSPDQRMIASSRVKGTRPAEPGALPALDTASAWNRSRWRNR
ncbi:MAG: hypothetical protein OXH52_22335, partial [Gammaproteobacteria bacterium]|nr:hypothetical protein [Gammaproteobacteria bacterium]